MSLLWTFNYENYGIALPLINASDLLHRGLATKNRINMSYGNGGKWS